jgi:hypothetical protein
MADGKGGQASSYAKAMEDGSEDRDGFLRKPLYFTTFYGFLWVFTLFYIQKKIL